MPVYEFSCPQGCEDYEIWRSIDQRSVKTQCPECGTEGKRLFSPPVALCGPLRLKEESREPKIVRKSSGPSEAKAKLKTSQGARPWMLNRGCS
jgi:putative FmdB family regulatory protein